MKGYKVYKSDPDDNVYTRNHYSFKDRTIQLLVKNKEVSDQPSADEIEVKK